MDDESQRNLTFLVSNEFTEDEIILEFNINELCELNRIGSLPTKPKKGLKAYTEPRSRKECLRAKP